MLRRLEISSSFTPEYRAIIAYANSQGYTVPQPWDQYQENNLLKNLKRDGIWAITDQMFNFSTTGDINFSLINWKAPGTRNATIGATPMLWEKGISFTGNAVAGYINSNYIPSTNGVNFTQNNAGVFIKITQDIVNTTSQFGAGDSGLVNFIHLGVLGVANNAVMRLNEITNVNIANTTSSGNWAISRSGATTLKMFKNGSQLGSTSGQASTGVTTKAMFIGAYNNNGAATGFTNMPLAFYSIGANLDATISAYHTDLNAFLATSKTISIPAFASKNVIADYISAASLLTTAFQYNEPAQKITALGSSFDYYSGALAGNGFIYTSPGSATVACKISETTGAVTTFGSHVAGTFKYGGAVYKASSGMVYLIPSSSTVVAKINTSTDAITFFDTSGVQGTESGNLGATVQKYYSGQWDPTGRYIFCIPYNATAVLVIDTSNDSIFYVDTTGNIGTSSSGNLSGSQKWDTGCSYGQYAYGTPSDALDMLKVDMTNFICTRVGTFPSGTAKWSQSVISPQGGYIYFFPYFRNDIIKLDVTNNTYTTLSGTIGTNNDAKTKTLLCKIMPTGNILIGTYDLTLTNNYILNPTNDVMTSFVRQGTAIHNGAVLCTDGSIQGIPQISSTAVKYYFPRRSITLPSNFVYNQFLINY